jgi:hypothetical protein
MAARLDLTVGLVVSDVVGLEDVVAVMDNHVAVESRDSPQTGLAAGIQMDGETAGSLGHNLSHREGFLRGVVGKGNGFRGRGGENSLGGSRGCHIGQRLRAKLKAAESQKRDTN